MLDLVPTSCVEDCERVGVVYSQFVFVIPWWTSLCGRSLVDIVEIFLCEGGDVEQWLESRNISLCLRLDLSLNSLSLSLCLALLILLIYIRA